MSRTKLDPELQLIWDDMVTNHPEIHPVHLKRIFERACQTYKDTKAIWWLVDELLWAYQLHEFAGTGASQSRRYKPKLDGRILPNEDLSSLPIYEEIS